ncbi:hypothetical protein GH714_038388 [Hevea brasiliensis]|uniref:Laccase n=1 Tax=Hevea brasiliensis TaxID=3981 RepID=A0A6A6MN45_HEVBR|nr:hypothetical protein GH714_038388 [Hevea brasiliensis]
MILCLLSLMMSFAYTALSVPNWPGGRTTRFYDFKVHTMTVNKLCNTKEIVAVNNMYPGPVVYAQQGDRIIVKVTNESPYNVTIHWHGVRQILSCWFDGPSYITQCPIQPGQSFTYEFTLVRQKGTFFWHAHVSWLRGTVYGAIVVYPKTGVPYPFPYPYEEHIVILEADAEYTKPFTTDRLMLGPGQTMIVLVTADQPIGKYSMAMGPYMSAQGPPFQNISAIAYFQYLGAVPNSISLPARLPNFNDNLAVKTVMDGLRGLNTSNVPKEIDTNLFVTIGVNVNKCRSKTPQQNCQGINNGTMAASMNNISFIKPTVSVLEAYYKGIEGFFTEDFPEAPLRFYDFVNGAPNNAPVDTNSMNGTRTKVVEYGTRVQIILQDTGTISTENHPIHLHGYSFYVGIWHRRL